MVTLLQIGILSGLLAAVGGRVDAAQPGVDEILATLRVRHKPIVALSCTFSQKRMPTQYFINRAAKDLDVPPAKVEQKYKVGSLTELFEAADGRYLLRVSELGDSGRPARKDVMGFDGRIRWKQLKVPIEDDPSGQSYRDSKTEIGGKNHAILFTGSAYPVASYLGDSVLASQMALGDLIRDGQSSERLEDESVGGSPCAVIRWQLASGDLKQRNTAWMDTSRGLALRKYTEELLLHGNKWIRTRAAEAVEMGVTAFKDAAGKQVEYHYPKIVHSEIFNGDDNLKTFDEHCEFKELRINPPTPNDLFALHIDEGTGVFDLDTGKYSVFGRGPGENLKKIIDRRVKEADKQASESGLSDVPDIQSPPPSLASRGMWVGLALGVVGIAAALILKIRGSRSP